MSQTKVITGKVRLSYFNGFVAVAMDKEKPDDKKFSTTILIPKGDTKTMMLVHAAIDAASADFKAKNNGKLPKSYKLPVRDGDEEADEKGEAYAGHWFFSASSKRQPGIIDKDRQEIIDKSEVKSGDYARVSLNFYEFDIPGKSKGVAVGLNNIQKLADGEALGGNFSKAEDDFADDFEDDDEFGL